MSCNKTFYSKMLQYTDVSSFKAGVPDTWDRGCWEAGLLQQVKWQQAEAHTDPTQDDHTWDQSTGHWVH